MLGVPVGNIFQALQVYIGSAYVNDFTCSAGPSRSMPRPRATIASTRKDIDRASRCAIAAGALVPLGSLVAFRNDHRPAAVTRYNIYPGDLRAGPGAPGVSSTTGARLDGEGRGADMPEGVGFEWTEIAYQERNAGNTADYVFGDRRAVRLPVPVGAV